VISFLLLRNFAWGADRFPELTIGPLRLSIFGLLAALDLLFGLYLIERWCERFDLDWPALAAGLPWIILLGYYISHLVSVALYYPHELSDLRALLDPRTRISSFGGMFGGGLVAVIVLRRRGLSLWRYGDALTLGFVGGYVFGRAGCFAIHDHLGRVSDFFLAINIDGVQRHDLGFYEMWLMLGLLIAVLFLSCRRRPPDGFVIAFATTLYAPIRFLLDFLRVEDITYSGLTPGQWLALPMFALGVSAWARLVTRQAG
jgi:phosphatidylglycerol:prolipoprotein diacylglycerol transferase